MRGSYIYCTQYQTPGVHGEWNVLPRNKLNAVTMEILPDLAGWRLQAKESRNAERQGRAGRVRTAGMGSAVLHSPCGLSLELSLNQVTGHYQRMIQAFFCFLEQCSSREADLERQHLQLSGTSAWDILRGTRYRWSEDLDDRTPKSDHSAGEDPDSRHLVSGNAPTLDGQNHVSNVACGLQEVTEECNYLLVAALAASKQHLKHRAWTRLAFRPTSQPGRR
jgi:hypothetical protein